MALLALAALIALTFPYALNLTWAAPAADHTLTYRKGSLTWDSGTAVDANGTARLTLFAGLNRLTPGTGGHNTVSLKNNGTDDVTYTAVLYRLDSGTPAPVNAALTASGARTAETFRLPADADEADVVRAVTGTAKAYSQQTLDIDWDWLYEGGVDDEDTAAGTDAPSQLTLGLYVVVNDNGTSVIPKTGDNFPVRFFVTCMILSLLGLVYLAVSSLRRRKPQ